jgi:anti-sigma regulatory factor (Ser/Thr protein kinase)
MEMIVGSHHTSFPMGDASRVGEARRHAAQLAHDCGLDEVTAGQLAIVVNELGNNLVRHAQGGRLFLSSRSGRSEVEVIAVDEGPGIADIDRCLGDGYSTGGTPGTGLGAVRRLARDFDIHSAVPEGTIVVARLRPAGQPDDTGDICVGGVALAAPGETVCGDAWAFAQEGRRAALLVADGLGHGPDAAEASQAAVAVFQLAPLAAPRQQIERLHARLRSTRGAALSLMLLDDEAGTIRVSGAGNIFARVLSGIEDRTLLSQHGTVGVTIRTPEEIQVAWPAHALLVACSDGIETRWKPELLRPVLGRDPSLVAALLVRDHCRGRDDATAVVVRRRH